MARPKKLSDADAIRLVDSLYEQCGDRSRLKFSELEKHAILLGVDVKAYDLRRNDAVLSRIAAIEALELNTGGIGELDYKGLDIDGFINNNRSPDRLRHSLSELDGRWRKLFDHAVGLSKRVSALTDELRKSEASADSLNIRNAELFEKASADHSMAVELKTENTYLRRMIRECLYPSLADSVLGHESISEASGATQVAIDAMTDGAVPAPLTRAIAVDTALRSREDILLDSLRRRAMVDDPDAP